MDQSDFEHRQFGRERRGEQAEMTDDPEPERDLPPWSELSEHMQAALRDVPLIRLHGGWWVAEEEGIDPMATKGDRPREANIAPIADVETHRTVTVKALLRRDLIEVRDGETWTAGARAVLNSRGEEVFADA